MLCACIDIGSNTTRLLVSEVRDGGLREVLQRRAFTRLGTELRAEGFVKPEKVAEVARVVAEQRALAEELEAVEAAGKVVDLDQELRESKAARSARR